MSSTTQTPPPDTRRSFDLGKLVLAFPLLLFLGVLLFFVIMGVRLAWSNYAKQTNFQPITVTILDKNMVQHTRRSGPNSRDILVEYQPMVGYRYEVDGQPYENYRVWPQRIAVNESWAREVLQQFQVGHVYQGFYDPNNPADSFLLQDYNPAPAIVAIFAVVIFMVIGTMFLRSMRTTSA